MNYVKGIEVEEGDEFKRNGFSFAQLEVIHHKTVLNLHSKIWRPRFLNCKLKIMICVSEFQSPPFNKGFIIPDEFLYLKLLLKLFRMLPTA